MGEDVTVAAQATPFTKLYPGYDLATQVVCRGYNLAFDFCGQIMPWVQFGCGYDLAGDMVEPVLQLDHHRWPF